MKKNLKKITLSASLGMLVLAFSLPTSAKEEVPAAKCSPQACQTDAGIGICCLVGTGNMTCSPCGAVDVVDPAGPLP